MIKCLILQFFDLVRIGYFTAHICNPLLCGLGLKEHWPCPLSSNRQHYHIDGCLEDNREDYSKHRPRMRILRILRNS